MINEKGFTLTELLLVMVVIGIIGATAVPFFTNPSLFQERFFIDEFSNMVRFASKAATSTGCEIALKKSADGIGLYMRQNCDKEDFTRPVLSPYILEAKTSYHISLPKSIRVSALPIYIDSDGKVYDANHQWQRQLELHINQQHLYIDGYSGLVYEKI